ncbi:EAL domain-containing protein [Vibrio lentus]|nr:EAL domain-containing protein [Vibrio lentus]
MSHILDQYVIEKMIEKLNAKEVASLFAINISPSLVFLNEVSSVGLAKLLSKMPQSLTYSALRFQKTVSSTFRTTPRYCNTIRNADAVFGVDNCGRNCNPLDYINEYRPSYVKLDYLFTHNLDDEKRNSH